MTPAAAALPQHATSLTPVLNATGIVVHTNLGRAPLAAAARRALQEAAGHVDVELDLATGTGDLALEILRRDGVTIFAGVPTMYVALLHQANQDPQAVEGVDLRAGVSGQRHPHRSRP